MTVAGVHWVITIVRASYPRIARILDGTPLVRRLLRAPAYHPLALATPRIAANAL
jgi:hypothetical protein